MATITSISQHLLAEIARANAVTSYEDVTVHDAITHLIAGYGQGEPVGPITPVFPMEGFTQMQYLESSGTQYIDTGYAPKANSVYEIDGYFTSRPKTAKLFGSGSPYIHLLSTGYVRYGDSHDYGFPDAPTTRATYNLSSAGLIIDNVIVNDTRGSVTPKDGAKIYLFGVCNINRVAAELACGRIYGFKIYENEELVLNLVPAMRNSDHILGFYDMISGNFYTNRGTGSFAAEEVV